MIGAPGARKFGRPEHYAVLGALHTMDPALLVECRCWFGGGTAIVLDLGEYRVSKDIDFLCSDEAGYRRLRNAVATGRAAALFGPSVRQLREFRMNQYSIRGTVEHAGIPLLVEIVREARIALDDGVAHPTAPVPTLSPTDQVAEKLMANADRCMDQSSGFRDAIDLGMLLRETGTIPTTALAKVVAPYGEDVRRKALWAMASLSEPDQRSQVAATLGMDPQQVDLAVRAYTRAVASTWQPVRDRLPTRSQDGQGM